MATKTLKPGDSGKEVKNLQKQINAKKPKKKLKIDGDYGPKTEDAVRDMQKRNRLKQTGSADAKFFGFFEEEVTVIELVHENPRNGQMTVEVTDGQWRRTSGRIKGIGPSSGTTASAPGHLNLIGIGNLNHYSRTRGASGTLAMANTAGSWTVVRCFTR